MWSGVLLITVRSVAIFNIVIWENHTRVISARESCNELENIVGCCCFAGSGKVRKKTNTNISVPLLYTPPWKHKHAYAFVLVSCLLESVRYYVCLSLTYRADIYEKVSLV